MAIFSSIKKAYQSATKSLQNVGATIASNLSKVGKQPAAVGMAFPVTTASGQQAIQKAGVSAPTNLTKNTGGATGSWGTPAPTGFAPLQGGDIAKAASSSLSTTGVKTGRTQGSSFSSPVSTLGTPNIPQSISTDILSSGANIVLPSAPGSSGIYSGGGSTSTGAGAGAFTSLNNLNKGIYYGVDKYGNPVYESASPSGTELKDTRNQDEGLTNVKQLMRELGLDEQPQNKGELFADLERQSQVQEYRRQVDDYTSQLKVIQAQSQADQLSLVGQGRGIPEPIIGGQQAKIAREAAIKALPISALLESAQGRYETAQSHLDTMFKLISDDFDNQRQYKMSLFQTVAPFMNAAEKRRLELIDKADERTYQENKTLNETKKTLYSNIMAYAPQASKQALMNAVGLAKNDAEAIAAAGVYGGDNLDRQIKEAQLAKTLREVNGNEADLTSKQYTALNQITTRFQADAVINQAVKGQTASTIADQIIANPGSATSQLKSLYVLVKNLDPDSAVREGELALANQTQSYLQQFGNVLTRVNTGRVISPNAAAELALATKELLGAWNSTAQKRQKQYDSQANVLGVADEFNSYIKGSELGYNESNNPLGLDIPITEGNPLGI